MESNHPDDVANGALPKSSWGLDMDDAQRPSEREMRENSRSRSAILHVLRKRIDAVRLVDLERVAYPRMGWTPPPECPAPPPVTFQYEEAGGGSGDGGDGKKKEKKEKKNKKEKKDKRSKVGSKWKEC